MVKHQGNDLPDGGRGIKPLNRFGFSKSEAYFCPSHFSDFFKVEAQARPTVLELFYLDF